MPQITVLTLFLAFCGQSSAAERVTETRLGALFAERGIPGVIVLYDPAADRFHSNDFSRAERSLLPASTFKIPHAMIALETGAVSDAAEVIPWDGRKRGWDKWDRDQTLASALRWSAVWAFQVIARRIGPERMSAWVERLDYGNRDISGNIDSFWLDGGLRISAMQQIAFLRRLRDGALPVSDKVQAEVRRILIVEQTDNYILRAKTGWVRSLDPHIGWYVGWIEAGQRTIFFALNMDMHHPKEDRNERIAIAWEALEQFGFNLLPE